MGFPSGKVYFVYPMRTTNQTWTYVFNKDFSNGVLDVKSFCTVSEFETAKMIFCQRKQVEILLEISTHIILDIVQYVTMC